ncbi:MAG: hypothetical protein QOI82_2479 [Actinomycetota bacterium]|jgi:hypothetical protein|nr:hypothetical protein [Actinomycetota bacterium]
MANGQAVLAPAVLDTAEVELLHADLEAGEAHRHGAHAAQLGRALRLDRIYRDAGMALQTTAELALLWRCSEEFASARLWEAEILDRLGALPAMRTGLLTMEQGRIVVDVLGSVDDDVALAVWLRLQQRLEQDARIGAVLPPARTAELLRRWLLELDQEGAIDRRKQAEEAGADVDLWKRDDGLVDIAIRAVTGPNAQAVGQRIREHAEPIGSGDNRPVGMRYRDAAIDLILGRTTLPFTPESAEAAAELGVDLSRCGRPGCGCGQGSSAPCGVEVSVLVPISSALGTSDAPAELVGHGPIDAELLDRLLLSAPVLKRVWVDPDTGVPVAVDDRTWTPPRHDPVALRAALLDIAGGDPPRDLVPVHPDDHPPRLGHPPTDGGRAGPVPPDGLVLAAAALGRPELLDRPHPVNTPGPYVVPRRLRRLLLVRSPRCEWPGCGRRAVKVVASRGCDVDHDLAWPAGPTCACNTGPLCRRHHRIKQLGWVKQRRVGGHVRWTSPLGRRWLSRSQQQSPPAPVRPIAPLPAPDPFAGLTDGELAQALWHGEPGGPMFDAYVERPTPEDVEPPDVDDLADRYRYGDLWTRLDDPTAWHPYPEPEAEQ